MVGNVLTGTRLLLLGADGALHCLCPTRQTPDQQQHSEMLPGPGDASGTLQPQRSASQVCASAA